MARRRRRTQGLAFAGVSFYVLKAGVATAIASALAIMPYTADLMGGSGDWIVITVTVVCAMGPTLGGVVSRGVNRGVGTLVAVILAVPINMLTGLGDPLVGYIVIPTTILLVTICSYYLINRARSAASEWEYALVLFNLSFCMLLHVNHRLGITTSLYRIGTILLGALLALLAAGAWPYLASDRLDCEAAAALEEAGKLVRLSAVKFTIASGDGGALLGYARRAEQRDGGKGERGGCAYSEVRVAAESPHAGAQQQLSGARDLGAEPSAQPPPSPPPLRTFQSIADASAAVASSHHRLKTLRANVRKNIAFAKWEPRRGARRHQGAKRQGQAGQGATEHAVGSLEAAPEAIELGGANVAAASAAAQTRGATRFAGSFGAGGGSAAPGGGGSARRGCAALASRATLWLAGGALSPLLESYGKFEKALEDFEHAAASLDALGVSAAQESPLSPLASPSRESARASGDENAPFGGGAGTAELSGSTARSRGPAVVPLGVPIRALAFALDDALLGAAAAVGTIPRLIRLQPVRLLGAHAPRVCESEAHRRVERARDALRAELERFAARLRGGTAQEVLDRARALAFAQEIASLAAVQYARLAAAADDVVDLSMGDREWRERSQSRGRDSPVTRRMIAPVAP